VALLQLASGLKSEVSNRDVTYDTSLAEVVAEPVVRMSVHPVQQFIRLIVHSPPPCVCTNNSPSTGSDRSSVKSLSATHALISVRDQVACEFFWSPATLSYGISHPCV
jgi:hypothetical protein